MAAFLAATAFSVFAQPALAQDADDSDGTTADPDIITDMPEIVVYGRGEQRIGTAGAASEGGVTGADISLRPLSRPGEVLESTPGLIATQHSGGGKANQYFLRGFNLDHGTDYALYIDDMPMNFRTHGHGQGYLDVNGLIPEIVERVDYRKGPYRADTGDFSFVGSSFITTRDEMEPFALVEAGMYDYYRAVAGGSFKVGVGDLAFAGQAKFNNGPWELPESYKGYSAFAKYSVPLGMGQLEASFNGFWATWDPTEQIPERAVGTLIKDRYGSLDKTLTGRTERETFTVRYTDDDWKLTAWAQHYDWSLLNNFTFYLDDPVNGDQRRQYDNLWGYGGRIERNFTLNDTLSLRGGTELRADDIGTVGLDHTIAGAYDYTYSTFSVNETSAGVYAEAVWRPVMGLMVIGGGRGDFYRFKTTPLAGGAWGGTVKDSLFAPKVGANYEIAPGIALYANYGQGFHSNDARGVTNPVSPAPGLVKGHFKEVGGRFERGGLILSGVYWWSFIASELIYVGDSGAVEPSDPGRRRGYELTAFWKPNGWLALDGVWTGTHSRYVGLPKGEDFVPGALESSGEIGVSALFPDWNASMRVRYLGPHPIIEDNSQRGEPTTLLNFRAAWTPQRGHGWEVYAELLNALDSKRDDIDYYYATRFPGEPVDGVEDRNSRIVEPRQVRVGIRKTF
ncbi:TonB-dependent receptor [Croceibacterium salegens]|nr:TonB-dependent receptor [Croceibacterium salegens]